MKVASIVCLLVNRPIQVVVTLFCAALLITTVQVHADITGLGAAMPGGTQVRAAPTVAEWTHQGGGIAYLFAGTVTLDTPGARPYTELAVGAQLNAYAAPGSHQIVFGIATEAWSLPGAHAMLTGIEATAINMEPENPWRKISMWSTYKTRPDTSYDDVPADPSNMNAQALRIESQPGTGFERGIVLARYSLHASRVEARPILVDLREVPAESIAGWDLVAFPDGCRLRYAGRGRLATAC
jgi:hypothetical protein